MSHSLLIQVAQPAVRASKLVQKVHLPIPRRVETARKAISKSSCGAGRSNTSSVSLRAEDWSQGCKQARASRILGIVHINFGHPRQRDLGCFNLLILPAGADSAIDRFISASTQSWTSGRSAGGKAVQFRPCLWRPSRSSYAVCGRRSAYTGRSVARLQLYDLCIRSNGNRKDVSSPVLRLDVCTLLTSITSGTRWKATLHRHRLALSRRKLA